MNDGSGPTELAQNQFATAVRNFTPKLSARFQKLLPFKDGIAELLTCPRWLDNLVES